MSDSLSVRSNASRTNVAHYRRLLETHLTELERAFIQRRLSEELSNLEALKPIHAGAR
jgi:hypothetical protein